MRGLETRPRDRLLRTTAREHDRSTRRWDLARCWQRMAVIFFAIVAANVFLLRPIPARCEGPSSPLHGSWIAETIERQTVAPEAPSTISFDESGRVNGSGGCNHFAGAATIDGSSIRFGNLASTMRACPENLMAQEQQFYQALAATRSWRIEGTVLDFLGADGESLVRFIRSEH